ncbi:hypothetical protein A4X13_0g8854 [Tilletia indica]|uniref:Uncharacterized protein n=1 Tax=Tilletia indica TaxID=43049 RepID=A0A8T8SD94_9BASI|nr:hypothetical protein A4X13_0g8854 [Tilletia indica]
MIVQRPALVLIVEGILTAMPTALAVSLAIGAERSAKRKALGTHTAPIEKILAVIIPYSDKTSTVKTNRITIDPETGELSSKGQAHQRGDHPRLRVSAWNREPIPSIRGVGTRRSSVEPQDSTVSLTEIALALFASYIVPLDHGEGGYSSSVGQDRLDTDSVAQVYFVKDAVEPDLLAGSNTVFSREETKDSEAAMLLIREIDEGMGGGHSLSHGDYGEQVPSNSRRCSTFRRVVVHSPSTSAIGVQYGLRMIVPPPSGTSSHSVSAQNPLTSPPIRWQFDSDHSASSALLLPRESRSPSSPGVLFEPALAAGPADQPSRSV